MLFINKGYRCIPFVLLFLHSILQAQQTRPTLTQLINAASKYSQVLKQQQLKIKMADASLAEAKHNYLPVLNVSDQLNIGTDNSISGSYLPLNPMPSASGGIRADNVCQASTGNLAALYAQYELFDFGLKHNKIDAVKTLIDVEQADMNRSKYALQLTIGLLYFNLAQREFQLTTDVENVHRYADLYKVIQALTKSGLKPGADSSLALAELSKARSNYNTSAGNLQYVKQQLSYWTGVDTALINADTTSLKQIPATGYDTAIPYQHPDITYIQQQKKYIEAGDAIIHKSYLPKLFVAASGWARGSSIQYNDRFTALSEGLGLQRFNYLTGISLTYDLFGSIHARDKLAQNRYQLQELDAVLDQKKQYLENEKIQADNATHTLATNLLELPVQIKSAADVMQQKVAQYKAGLINLIDLTNAGYVLYRSRTDYAEALMSWYITQLQRAAATATLDSFIQSIK